MRIGISLFMALIVIVTLALLCTVMVVDAQAGTPAVAPHVILGVRANQDLAASIFDPVTSENDLLEVEAWAGRKLADNQYSNWADFGADLPLTQAIWDAEGGRTPLLSWKPFKFDAQGHASCATMQDIGAGVYHDQLIAQGHRLAEVLGKIMVRPFYEMEHSNPCAYGLDNVADPVAAGLLYIAAYRYIHDTIAPIAPNVVWVFAPGASAFNDANDQPVTIWADYYPGDDVVDWIGEDVYNGVKIKSFQTFPAFVNFYNQVAPLGKPLAITETGALCDSGVPCPGSKWIYSAHHNLKDFPAVQAWFWWSSMGQSGRDFRLKGADINEFISIGGSAYFQRMAP